MEIENADILAKSYIKEAYHSIHFSETQSVQSSCTSVRSNSWKEIENYHKPYRRKN